MHRDGKGVVELAELFEGIPRKLFVKIDPDKLAFGIDAQNGAEIAVKDARPNFGSRAGRGVSRHDRLGIAAFTPYYIIVVPDLHHPIALPEHSFAKNFFFFSGRGRIERLL